MQYYCIALALLKAGSYAAREMLHDLLYDSRRPEH